MGAGRRAGRKAGPGTGEQSGRVGGKTFCDHGNGHCEDCGRTGNVWNVLLHSSAEYTMLHVQKQPWTSMHVDRDQKGLRKWKQLCWRGGMRVSKYVSVSVNGADTCMDIK